MESEDGIDVCVAVKEQNLLDAAVRELAGLVLQEAIKYEDSDAGVQSDAQETV